MYIFFLPYTIPTVLFIQVYNNRARVGFFVCMTMPHPMHVQYMKTTRIRINKLQCLAH